ncbi:hypothetical protein [Streptomyces sp. NPDC002644]
MTSSPGGSGGPSRPRPAAGYLMPVNADVPDMEVFFVGGPAPATAVGTKGVDEAGLAAAIGNAVRHATGRRPRDLPFALDRLML